jgi:predicted dehydrogenase
MKQLIQNFNDGKLRVEEIPCPVVQNGGVLVKIRNSLLSVGTEKMISEFSKKTLLGKALARPDLVKQVMDKVKKEGILATIPKVKSRLETSVPLGYSCSGEIIETGEGVEEFCVGDKVACAGMNYASHGEINFVPKNLCVKLPDNVDFEEASFVTLGSIALQGVRQAEVRLGERIVVIGLGLLGLLTVQLLKAAGCRVLGSDIDPKKIELAKDLGADEVTLSHELVSSSKKFSDEYGADAVIITASTSSNEPIEVAGEISKHKGRVVVVGMVGMNIPRNLYYKKELDLRLSMSYGPGRYDPNYEEKGIDYPFGYVRWTERRNMEAFLQLIGEASIDVKKLITHRFKIEDALKAYELVMSGSEFFVGVLLAYPQSIEHKKESIVKVKSDVLEKNPNCKIQMAVVGAGNFTKAVLLPKLQKINGISLRTLCDIQGANAIGNAKKFGFAECASDYRTVLEDKGIDAVIITTRHNLHAKMVKDALTAGKHVYVEKPLALNRKELDEIVNLRENTSKDKLLMVGFNRRFAPLTNKLKAFLGNNYPFIINYRVNAGFIPKDNWIQDPEIGGGRIIGEVCHFVDFIKFLVNARIKRVYAESISGEHDNINVSLKFEDGSIGSISYIAIGDTAFPKERVEIFGNNSVAIIDDFRNLTMVRGGKTKTLKNLSQDKGHGDELKAFVEAAINGGEWPIKFEDMISATMVTFDIIDSLRTGEVVRCQI